MKLCSTQEAYHRIRKRMKREWVWAFCSAFLLGMLIHMPMLLLDAPNHDGLASVYFDQNMITSGRWFLTVACGISSYYTLPWMIGVLSLLYLSLTAAVLTEFLQIRQRALIVGISGLLVSFPALASTYAYIFTADGYMLALFLAVLAVLLVQKGRYGYIWGGICLAFSMGTYQAYLAFAILLSIYGIVVILLGEERTKLKIKNSFRYLWMGIIGVSCYYILLQLLLKIQGKELDTYQGISGLEQVGSRSLSQILQTVYYDFAAFSARGHVVFDKGISVAAVMLLALLMVIGVAAVCRNRKLYKSPWLYVVLLGLMVLLPIGTNAVLVISPEVNYHLLMRYQWVLYLILAAAFVQNYWLEGQENDSASGGRVSAEWGLLAAVFVLILYYGVTDNIAYSNLQKKYEKTYAYCLRLADRMEQTEGYYQGIPIAMIGVVSEKEYPETDITKEVTAPMIGISGDSLLYTGINYQAFMKHYLGITINLVAEENMPEIYDSPEYQAMDSFPGADSVKVVDGILYIKTE